MNQLQIVFDLTDRWLKGDFGPMGPESIMALTLGVWTKTKPVLQSINNNSDFTNAWISPCCLGCFSYVFILHGSYQVKHHNTARWRQSLSFHDGDFPISFIQVLGSQPNSSEPVSSHGAKQLSSAAEQNQWPERPPVPPGVANSGPLVVSYEVNGIHWTWLVVNQCNSYPTIIYQITTLKTLNGFMRKFPMENFDGPPFAHKWSYCTSTI